MKEKLLNYLKNYGFNSIIVLNSLKIFIIFIIITAIPIGVAYWGYINTVTNDTINTNRVETQKVATVFETFFRDMEYLAADMISDDVISEFLSMRENSYISDEFEGKLVDRLNTYTKGRTGMTPIYIYNEPKNLICTIDGIKPANKLNLIWTDNYEKGFIKDYKIVLQKNNYNTVRSFAFLKKAPNLNGAVVVNIDALKIKKKIQSFVSNKFFVYVFMGEETVYKNTSDVPAVVNSFAREPDGYLKEAGMFQNSVSSSYYDFKYIVASDAKAFLEQTKNIYLAFFWILLAFLIIAIGLSLLLSMNSLGYVMGFIDLLETRKKPKALKDNEIKYVTDKILYIIDDNEKLKAEIEKRMVLFDEMKRKALQAQISPHFLNNSLNVVNYKLITECGYDTVTSLMLSKLSRIVEYSYITDNMFVCLESEIDFVNDYIDFLKLRYGEFVSEIYVDETIKDMKIPKMLIQPFVENSVFHGLKKKGDMIIIRCIDNDDSVEISIYDNGVGMSPEELSLLKNALENEAFMKEHIGIKNVYNRIKLIYGEYGTINFDSVYGEYTRITIKIRK